MLQFIVKPYVFRHLDITTICSCWSSSYRFILVIITSILLGKLSTRFWIVALGICSFNYMSISEIRHWCWVRKPGAQLAFKIISKLFSRWRSGPCTGTQGLLLQPLHIMSLWSSLIAQGHCHTEECLGFLVPVKRNLNATACKYI